MVSRRDFLQASVLTAGAGVCAATHSFAQSKPPEDVPPAIAALKSMKDLAKPITREEREQRQHRAQELMTANHLDAIVIMGGTSLQYFTGISWWNSERMFAMVLPAKAAAFYVCPAFEEGRAREQLSKAPNGQSADVLTWQEDESPYALLARGLKDRGVSTGSVGLEESVQYVFTEGLTKAAPHLKIASATPVTAGCRMIKSAHELDLMHVANNATLAVYEAAYKSLKEGMTDRQVSQLVGAGYQRVGFRGYADVLIGTNSSSPHGSANPQVVREGTIVLIDDGCQVEGYGSDITRTFCFGKFSDKMKRVFDIVHRAQAAALKTARPGIECGAVDTAARKVITDGGFGPDYKYFTHRLGHGIGMDGHEWPYLVRGNKLPLAKGMTFSDEPGIYIPGEFGIRLEDDMYITENGAELFTPQSPSLEDPFGKS
jgi:Xaa-Pro dipeptidase